MIVPEDGSGRGGQHVWFLLARAGRHFPLIGPVGHKHGRGPPMGAARPSLAQKGQIFSSAQISSRRERKHLWKPNSLMN
jgi:hypothetical protein